MAAGTKRQKAIGFAAWTALAALLAWAVLTYIGLLGGPAKVYESVSGLVGGLAETVRVMVNSR
jgi:membrane protein DedA with SNARE-associated domain